MGQKTGTYLKIIMPDHVYIAFFKTLSISPVESLKKT